MAGLLALLPVLPLGIAPISARQEAAGAVPLRMPPPLPAAERTEPSFKGATRSAGEGVVVNGLRQQARWELVYGELWLPLEVLEGQLGVSRSQTPDGALLLEWFGRKLQVAPARQRNLADEVAVPVSDLLQPLGVTPVVRGADLWLNLPARPLLAIRSRALEGGGLRIVFDLEGPSLLRSGDGRVLLGMVASPQQLQQLNQLGLAARQAGDWLSLRAEGQRLSLADPWRLVLDLPTGSAGNGTPAASTTAASASAPWSPARDPRLAQLMGQGLAIDRQVVSSGSQQVLLHSVRLDPRSVPLELRPLNRPDGMQGLSSLTQLARQEQALIAINGGYFNRVNRLPLGALRDDGIWLSGPILNRGAMGWEPGRLPSFGRLSLEETVEDSQGQRWAVVSLNSGYPQRGIARYTAAWGRSYQPITGDEMAVLIRQGLVIQRFEPGELTGGVPLAPGNELLVGRGSLMLPWQPGERLQLRSRPSHPLGASPFVIGGGPLLLQNGRLVLNGGAEGFSASFLSQGAPRTVIASDGRQLWLLTLQGLNGAGPTLLETAVLLQQQGLRDALNLDGGSSTGLVLGQEHTVKGRGVAGAVHNGLGLVARP